MNDNDTALSEVYKYHHHQDMLASFFLFLSTFHQNLKLIMVRPIVLLTLLGVLTYEVQALNKDCMAAMGKMMEAQTKLIVPCIESMGLSTGKEKKEKALCVMKCVMIKAKMLGPDGAVDMELATNLLEGLPDALKEKAGDVIQECGHHAASLDPNDATCESYRDFISCMLEVALRMCND